MPFPLLPAFDAGRFRRTRRLRAARPLHAGQPARYFKFLIYLTSHAKCPVDPRGPEIRSNPYFS